MSQRVEYWHGTGGSAYYQASGTSKGQTFELDSGYIPDQVKVRIKEGSGDAAYDVGIYGVGGSHNPVGAAIVRFGSFILDDITSSYATYTFNSENDYTLDPGTEYALVIKLTNGTGTFLWDGDSGYSDGIAFRWYGGDWDTFSDLDRWFEIWATEATPEKPITPGPTHEETGVDRDKETLSWVDGGAGQANAADSYDMYWGLTAGTMTKMADATTETEWMSPYVELTINNYRGAGWSFSGYRDVEVGDVLTSEDGGTSYAVYDTALQYEEVQNMKELKLYAIRSGPALNSSGSVLTNGVTPEWGDDNPQAVKVTLNNTEVFLAFDGNPEKAYYPFGLTLYWRVDATNDAGTTQGDVWEYTIFALEAPLPPYNIIGSGTPPGAGGEEWVDFTWGGENNMMTTKRLVAAAEDKIWIEDI